MSQFAKSIFPMQITKKIYTFNLLLIIIPIMALTVGLQLDSYKAAQMRREKNLIAVAQILDQQLSGSYTEILKKHNAAEKTTSEKVQIINQELQPKINNLVTIFPEVGMGYYSLELDRRVAFGPRFSATNLTAMPHDSAFQKIYTTGIPSINVLSKSFDFGSKATLGYSYPVHRNGKVIGHIYTNIKMSDIYLEIWQNVLIFLVLGFLLLTLTIWFSRKLFSGFKRDLAIFSNSLTSDEPIELSDYLPELNPIIELVKQHTGEKEKSIRKLILEVKKRKSIQKELLKANEKITTILDSIADAFFTLDNHGRFTYINDEAQRLFEAVSTEFIGKSIKEIPDLASALKDLRNSNEKQSKVCCEFFSENLRRWFEINVYLSGKGLGVYIKDITSRKDADSKISFQAAVMDQVRNIIIVTDLNGTVIYWNKSAEAACQWTDKEITGVKNIEIIVAHESMKIRNKMRQTVFQDGHWEGEFLLQRKDGSHLPIYLVSTAIKDATGQTIGIVDVGADISERKAMEKEMLRLDRLDLIGEMAAGIAHEVRNPMTTVRGFLQLMSNKEYEPEKISCFKLMIQEIDRANSIITEYLSLAKNKRVTLKTQSLNSIVSSLLPLLERGAIVNDITVISHLENIPNIMIDEKEIRQMILYLVRNGLDAMSPGGVLTVSTYLDDQDVVLEVEDQGSGIDPQIIDRLGTPFVTSKDGGTGLGMAVSYCIINRHNAKVSYTTGPMGTTFYVRFSETAQSTADNQEILTAV